MRLRRKSSFTFHHHVRLLFVLLFLNTGILPVPNNLASALLSHSTIESASDSSPRVDFGSFASASSTRTLPQPTSRTDSFLPFVTTQASQNLVVTPSGGSLRALDGTTAVTVQPGAVDSPTQLTYRRVNRHHPISWQYADAHVSFSLTANRLSDGLAIDQLRAVVPGRAKPTLPDGRDTMTISVHYRVGVVDRTQEARLVLAWFDDRQGAWVLLDSSVDVSNRTVTTSTDRLGEFALLLPLSARKSFRAVSGFTPLNQAPLVSQPPSGAIAVDDEDGGVGTFTRSGPAAFWWNRLDQSYYDSDMWFTYNSDRAVPISAGTWTTPPLPVAGNYTILAFIPLYNAYTQGATYQITHAGGTDVYLVNQRATRGKWVTLGTYPYAAGARGSVRLDDLVPERRYGQVRIGFDALVWLPPGVSWTPAEELLPYDPRWAQLGLLWWMGRGGEPVSTALGNFYHEHHDLAMPGRKLDVNFTRSYNSFDTRVGSFGRGSFYTYDMTAIDRGNGSIIVTLSTGRAGLYLPTGDGGFTRPDGFLAELRRDGDHLILTDVDQLVYTFNIDGALASISEPDGNTLRFAYDPDGYTLTDSVGRPFRVNFNVDGYIREIIDPIGRTYSYAYDGDKLVAFHNAQGGSVRYTYDAANHMESVIDPNGNTFIINHYDAQGRVDWQKDASNSTTTFSYQENPRRTTVVDSLGNATIHDYDESYRLIKETDALGYSMVYRYDNDNNRTYSKERGGHESVMAYDDQGNMTQITDALGQVRSFQYDPHNHVIFKRDEAGAETRYVYDARGNLTAIHDALGGSIEMTYTATGLIETLRNANGQVTHYSYDSYGNLHTIRNALGNLTTFEYDPASRLTRIIDANGHSLRFAYDRSNRLVARTDARGNTMTYSYDSDNNLTSTTDRRGATTRYSYDPNSLLIKEVNPLGASTVFTYDKMYHPISVTNRRGYTTRYQYDAVYNQIKTIDAKGNTTTLAYDPDRNLTTQLDALHQTTAFAYDALHRLVKMTNALGGVTEYGYDPVGRQVRLRDPKNGVTRNEYDRLGRLIKQIDALGQPTTFAYDPVGNMLTITNARGYTSHATYDAVNQLIAQTDPLGHTIALRYDGAGNLSGQTDARGNTTLLSYDPNNNLATVTDARGGVMTVGYDEENNRRSVTNQNGHTTTAAYDVLGNQVQVTLPRGQTTRFRYDQNNNLIASTNAKGATTSFTYDELDLLSSQTNPLGFVTAYAYDALRRQTTITDAEENATHYEYNALGWLTGVVDALGGRTRYDYDPLGTLTAFTDANGQRTSFERDLLGHITAETNPLGNTWRYSYDPVGNQVRRIDAKNVVTQYTFDADNQLTHIGYPSGPGVNFDYDPNHNLLSTTAASGATSFAYDALNRLVAARRSTGILVGTNVGYSYDPVGNRTGMVYPDGKAVSYTYDANEWLASMRDPLQGVTSYTYDPVGLLTQMRYPNQTWADYTYDAANRLVGMYNGKPEASSNLISSFDYTLDRVGNRIRTVERVTRGQVISWTRDDTYDKLYRLREAVETPDYRPAQVLDSRFSYDAVGNRLSMTTNIEDAPNTPPQPQPVTTNYTYNAANQLLRAGATRFSYDANGNRIAMDAPERAATYTYDVENRLTGAQTFDVRPKGKYDSDAVLDFSYDGLGRRIQRGVSDNGVRKSASYLYDGMGYDMLAQYVDPGAPRTTFYYRDAARVVSRHEIQGAGAGLQYFHHYDGLGSVSAWTNQSGRETQEYMYAPYGRLLDNNGPDNASNATDPHNSLTFSGKLWDQETELYNFGARDYDPATGTWLTQDRYRGTLSDPRSMQRYQYAYDNPTTWIDRYGFSTCPPQPSSQLQTVDYAGLQISNIQTHSQNTSTIINRYGYYACGLVAASSVLGANDDNFNGYLAAIRRAAGDDYRSDTGIQPIAYGIAVAQVVLSNTHSSPRPSSIGSWYDTQDGSLTIDGIYNELKRNSAVIVDIRMTDAGNVQEDYDDCPYTSGNPSEANYSHFARILGVDKTNRVIYIENTLTTGKQNFWAVDFDDFYNNTWANPETGVTSRSYIEKRTGQAVDNVSHWALIIGPPLPTTAPAPPDPTIGPTPAPPH